MRVLVTRPAAQAADWVQALGGRGLEAQALPLIDIAPPPDPDAVAAAWAALPQHRLAIFVSPNAAQQFFLCRPEGAAWPAGTWAASPGPGTSRILRRLGVAADRLIEPAQDARQFDSESLWLQLQRHDWQGARVLLVRGETGRDQLASWLEGRGARVEPVVAYRRTAPQRDPARQALLHDALAQPAAHAWLFSSSEAIGHLCAWQAPPAWARSTAVATHPRIAERARSAGFARVVECRPLLDDVVACIQSLPDVPPP